MNVHFCECDPSIKAKIEPFVGKWQFILPSWVYDLYVYCKDNDGPSGEAEVSPSYRRMVVTFYRPILTEPDPESIVVHELLHAYTLPMKILAVEYTEDCFPGESTPGTKTYLRRVTEAMEMANCDLENLFMARMK